MHAAGYHNNVNGETIQYTILTLNTVTLKHHIFQNDMYDQARLFKVSTKRNTQKLKVFLQMFQIDLCNIYLRVASIKL